ncbi:MAG TPA: cytochrome c [Bryobacteraceae bacterium]|nr:cytochrome c [Bryobacteraceae bacterium]
MTRLVALLLAAAALGWTQELAQILKQGEQVFQTSCATGYCHGAKGTPGGAPRLAGRGFDQSYISNTVTRGVPGTAMPAFGNTLSRAGLTAVVAYIASLNGIANPSLNTGPGGGPGAVAPPEPELAPEAARGRDLFFDAVRGFARCSTCHEVRGMGIPVATPISKVPATVRALRELTTSDVSTVMVDGDAMPALIVSRGKSRALFYDLTSVPPVLRTVSPGALKVSPGSAWRHSSVIGSYNDAELSAVLAFLRVAATP